MGPNEVTAVLVVLIVFGILFFPLLAGGADYQEIYERVNDFTVEGWDFKLGKSLKDLRAIGKVLRETATTVDNPHSQNQKDEIRELLFDGLRIVAYFPGKDHQRLLLQEVEISDHKFKIKHGLDVGVSTSKVTGVLGKPTEAKVDVHIYRGETDAVYFHFKKGAVVRVRWELYID
jgi:hypothetical protein